MINQHQVILFLCVAVILLSIIAYSSTPNTENYAAYPFGPQDPSNPNFNVYDTQSVYGQFGDNFDLTYSPETLHQGLYRTLEIANNRAGLQTPEWKVNDGFNSTGNVEWGLTLGEKPFYFWDYL
jgi:hypothetical protein